MPFPLFAPTVRLGEACPAAARVPLADVSHARLDALLSRYVDGSGKVAYAAWKASADDLQELHAYLAEVGRAAVLVPCAPGTERDAGAPNPAELAFWINVYNALTLAGVLRVYPTTSVRNHTGRVFGFNMWKHLRLHVAGTTLSLSDIEHTVLRALNDPRVHFALVCASGGCPVLRPRAFTPDAVAAELDESARAFLARPDAVRYEPDRRVVTLSKLFKWYGGDFGASPGEVLDALRRFLPSDALPAEGEHVRVTYQPYNWKLNARPPE